jgi:hypothetical protein
MTRKRYLNKIISVINDSDYKRDNGIDHRDVKGY